jgi:hypothetical protein
MDIQTTPWYKREEIIVPILVGIIVGVLPTVVPMNWIWLSICCLVLIICSAWIVVIVVPSKKIRNIVTIVVVVFLGIVGFCRVQDQWEKDHPSSPAKSPIEQTKQSTAKEIADEIIKKLPRQSPRSAQTNNKKNGNEIQIKFVFKNSALLTPIRKKNITKELNSFRNYLMGLGFEVPKETASMGIGSGKGASSAFGSSGNPVFDDIYVGEESIDDLTLWRKMYANYFFQRYRVRVDNRHQGLVGMILTDYFSKSYANQPPKDCKSFDGWICALWDIRNSCGQDFMDRTLYYASMIEIQDEEKDFNKYFSYRLFAGEWVVDNNFQNRPKIGQILRKYNLL